jgi:hypothetical protein
LRVHAPLSQVSVAVSVPEDAVSAGVDATARRGGVFADADGHHGVRLALVVAVVAGVGIAAGVAGVDERKVSSRALGHESADAQVGRVYAA